MTSTPATHIAPNASHGSHSRRHQSSAMTARIATAIGPPASASTSAAAAAASQYLTEPPGPASAGPGTAGRPGTAPRRRGAANRAPRRGPPRDGQAAPAISTHRASTAPPSSQWYPDSGVKLMTTVPPALAGTT